MKKQNGIWIFLVLFLVFGVLKSFEFFTPDSQKVNAGASYRNTKGMILTKHVRCRMGCREVTLEEIKDIIENGKLNRNKSGPGKKGDSTYALEGTSVDKQHLRVVVSPNKDGQLVVITCIDLEKEWPCNCK